jgi:choline dehydrogenase-like flavoprotein
MPVLVNSGFRGAALVVFCAAAVGQKPAADPLRATHDALFASFLPVNEVADKPEVRRMFLQARDELWAHAGQAAAFRALIAPFADLRGFGAACGLADLLKNARTNAFDQLGPGEQMHALYLLHACSSNEPRRLAMSVRNFYLRGTYGPLQEALTGVKLNLYAPDSYIKEHWPNLPPTRLRYDREKKQITHQDGEIDYLIVGSGPAGSVLGHELRRGGKRVVLLERGSFTVPGALETRLIRELMESNGTRTSTDGGIFIRNGMAVGGGSLVNVDLCFAPTLPSIQARMAGWRREGRISEEDFSEEELAKAYDWVKAAIGTRVLSESEINANNRALWDGAKRAGLHPKLYDLNTYPPGRSPFPVTDKRSAASELVLKALGDERNPLSLIPDAEVRRVLFDVHGGARRAIGVELMVRVSAAVNGVVADPNGLGLPAGERVTIGARNVILSAGALGSAAILLRSNVSNGQIGRGVVLHASMPVMGLFDRTVDALKGTQASVFVDDFLISQGFALEAMSAEPLYAAIMSPGPARHSFDMLMAYRNLAGFGVMLIDAPAAGNRVFLDKDGEPQIEYTLSQPDKERFRRGVALAVRVMFLAGAKKVYLPTTEDLLGGNSSGELNPVILTDISQAVAVEKQLQFIPNRTIVTSAHLQATNKMGASARESVVSRNFRVWGTEALYVVDVSVFPTSIGANPMQTIYTFSKIFADRMAGGRRKHDATPPHSYRLDDLARPSQSPASNHPTISPR